MSRRIARGVTAALALVLSAQGPRLLPGPHAGAARAQTPAAPGRGGAASAVQEGGRPLPGTATERGGLQRTGVFEAEGPVQAGGVAWASPKLFVMKREWVETSPPIIMRGGDTPFVFFGSNFYHSYPFDYSDPLVAGDTVYFSLYLGDGYLFAIDAGTGQSRWMLQRKKGFFSTPTVVGDTLYVSADGGVVYALDLKAHNERWRFVSPDKSGVMNAPAVTDDAVFFGTEDGTFYALDSRTGGVRWSFEAGQKSYWVTTALEGGTAFCGTDPGDLYALDTRTGKLVWKFKAPNGLTSAVASQGMVYLTSDNGDIISLDSRTGARRKARKSHKAGTLLALADETLYFGGWHGGNVYAVDAETGDVRWKFATDEPCNSPVVAGGAVYFTCEDKKLYAVEAKTGARLWALNMKETHLSNPAVAGGTIYLIGDSGKVYAVR